MNRLNCPPDLVSVVLFLAGVLGSAFLVHGIQAQDPGPAHPLDPLSREEIRTAAEVVHRSGKINARDPFVIITLQEPGKDLVYQHPSGNPFPRHAFVLLLDRPAGKTFEAVVDLSGKLLVSYSEREGVQPPMTLADHLKGEELIRQDPGWQAAMKKRGLTDAQLQEVVVDTWAAGYVPGRENQRLVRGISYWRGDTSNHYPHVVEGVLALADIGQEKVLDVLDLGHDFIPRTTPDFITPEQNGPPPDQLKPLSIQQPDGVSFEIRGHEVRWDNWSFRWSWHPREGPVLYQIAYNDGETTRPILYRASMNEMLVPYADPSATWNWRNAFDVGEYLLGVWATELRKELEVPENAVLLSPVIADDNGEPQILRHRLAIYEQDGGILWTHTDLRSGRTQTRRARQLVVHSIHTIGNYDYGIRWIFGQDGSLEVEVELTGIVLPKGSDEEACVYCRQELDEDGRLVPRGADRYGTLVAPQIIATHHQHFFNFRLDFDVDGRENSVYESEFVAEESVPSNPERSAFYLQQRVLRSELGAQRNVNPDTHRRWKIVQPHRRTSLGHFPAYELMPGTNTRPLAHPDSTVRKRAGFVNHHLWVTRFRPGEMYAAGDYPNQGRGGDGLPAYSADNEPLEDTDLVVWYTLGVSHAARAEEWPVMPVSRASFQLVPRNFFDRNPTLNVP
jgi:primary-amine oxidase